MTRELEGRRVLVTGAGRGIGARVAERFAEAGARVALCARTEAELNRAAEHITTQFGPVALPLRCDLAVEGAAEGTVAQVVREFGGIDVLVNNAASPGPFAYLEDADLAAWINTIEVNLFGTVRCCRAALPHMKRQRHGKIINLSGASVGWGKFTPLQSAYVTSKFAVYGLTEALAAEVGAFNVQVNGVSPGAVDTRLRNSLLHSKDKEADIMPAAELTPEATARMVLFLASERSGPMTGKLLSANWDDPDALAAQSGEANTTPINTLRKIDGRNYFWRW